MFSIVDPLKGPIIQSEWYFSPTCNSLPSVSQTSPCLSSLFYMANTYWNYWSLSAIWFDCKNAAVLDVHEKQLYVKHPMFHINITWKSQSAVWLQIHGSQVFKSVRKCWCILQMCCIVRYFIPAIKLCNCSMFIEFKSGRYVSKA